MGITTSVTLPAVHAFSGMDVNTVLADRVAHFGDCRFLVWESGRGDATEWTYREFSADVERVAAGLHERGVERGDAVLLLLENSPAFLLSWFACARIGAVAIDTNTRYASDELHHALRLTGAVGAVTHERLLERLEESGVELGWVATVDEDTGTCLTLSSAAGDAPIRPPDPGAPLCVQFTSGTTSRPKAVLFTHANALWGGCVGAAHARFVADDVVLVYAPLFHTAALSWQTLAAFWVGATVVLLPKYTASRFWEISLRHRCTQTNVLGIMMRTLAEQPVPEHHYRTWQFGAEAPALAEQFGVQLFNAWGMTEVVTQAIVNDIGVPVDQGAIGRAALEYRVRVTRGDGSDASVGEVGDLLVGGVRGLSIFAEYLDDPGATADAFDEDGYFRTGDRVTMLPSGALRFVSRAKDMLKVGGENVAAGEIERVLTTVPGVATAAVVGVPDRILDEVPVAFVTVTGDRDTTAVVDAALATCAAQLADFKVPRRVYVIDELPESLLGKVAKAALREEAIKRIGSDVP